MKYLHTMVRITDLKASLAFYCDALGLTELRRYESEQGRFTLVFLAAPGDESAQVELTYNWDPEPYSGGRNFGHLAYHVENIYATCQRLMDHGRDHKPSTKRRSYGICTLSRWHFCRAITGRQIIRAIGTLVGDGKYWRVVSI